MSYCHTGIKPKKYHLPLLLPWCRNKALELQGEGEGEGGEVTRIGIVGRKKFDGIHKFSKLENLVFSACPQNPMNGLKAVWPKLIWREPVRNKITFQKS